MVRKTNEKTSRSREKKRRGLHGIVCVFTALCLLTLSGGSGVYAQKGQEKTNDRFPETAALGGQQFGVRFETEGAIVYGVAPGGSAEKAGVMKGDILSFVNGEAVRSAADVLRRFEESKGKWLTLTLTREGKTVKLRMKNDEKSGAGLRLRDSISGIGTLSFYNPETGDFAGLGHGICEGASGTLLPLKRATVSDVRLTGVVKGEKGSPGQLRGVFEPGVTGKVTKNCSAGIYGRLNEIPKEATIVQTAKQEETHEGAAQVYCTVDGNQPQIYDLQIEKVLNRTAGGKDYLIRVTDEKLIEAAGGIVQGMSGSPILQDGKLVAVVTHVLVGDPTQGYAIAVERMIGEMT